MPPESVYAGFLQELQVSTERRGTNTVQISHDGSRRSGNFMDGVYLKVPSGDRYKFTTQRGTSSQYEASGLPVIPDGLYTHLASYRCHMQ